MRGLVLLLLLGLGVGIHAPIAAAAPAMQFGGQPAAGPDGCAPGYAAAGATCFLALPQHAVRNAAGDWTCGRGYFEDDGKCPAVNVPANAALSPYGHTWLCNAGYHESGNACEAGPAPAAVTAAAPCGSGPVNRDGGCKYTRPPRHARPVPGTSTWMCQPGFQMLGGQCVTAQMPRFAHPNSNRDAWLCDWGYKRADNRCVEIDVPDHATLGYDGNVWNCNRGYYEIRGVCLPETDEHRAAVAAYSRGLHVPQVVRNLAPAINTSLDPKRHGVSIFVLLGIAAAIFGTYVLFTRTGSQPLRAPPRNLRMAYVPKQRGAAAALVTWRPFGNRIDALTGASIAAAARTAQCRNCHAWYDADSVAALRQENEARCVACGRAALSYNLA